MGVLFLDIDGVVLSGRELWASGNNRYLPPEKIALVREVCDRTSCKIVVSSTWRISDETRPMLQHAGLPLHECPDCRAKRQEVRRALRMHFSAKARTSGPPNGTLRRWWGCWGRRLHKVRCLGQSRKATESTMRLGARGMILAP